MKRPTIKDAEAPDKPGTPITASVFNEIWDQLETHETVIKALFKMSAYSYNASATSNYLWAVIVLTWGVFWVHVFWAHW